MGLRFVVAATILLAAYLAFGDFVQSNAFAAPETFISSIGRGIGGAITSVASSLGGMIWG